MPVSISSPQKQPVTYGKSRKVSQSFSIFRDNASALRGRTNREKVFGRISRSKGKAPPSRVSFDEESIDELADEDFLKGVPKQLGAPESLRDEIIADDVPRPNSKRSFHTAKEILESKSLPARKKTNPVKADDIVRQPLANKTTNPIAKASKGDSRASNPITNAPVRDQRARTEEQVSIKTSHGGHPTTRTSRAEAHSNRSDFTRKISDLLQEAAQQEAESQRREAAYRRELAKPSPQQRAKATVIKSSRAVIEKLGSKRGTLKAFEDSLTDEMVSPRLLLGSEGRTKRRRGTLDRRVAEGINLSNPKIKSLTGNSSVPREPLPIYESMRSRVERSSTEEDPFLDRAEYLGSTPLQSEQSNRVAPIELVGGFRNGINDFKASETASSDPSSPDQQIRPTSKHVRHFSPELSGLAQHSDTLLFSSSPEATSTPFSKWHTRPTSLRKIRNAVSHRRNTKASVEACDNTSKNSTPVTDGGRSVKRRSGNPDLRSPSTPITKKARLAQPIHNDASMRLTSSINAMNTEDTSSRSPSPKIIRGKTAKSPQGKKKRGLGIFDVRIGKGKEKATGSVADDYNRPQLHSSHFSRPSFSRPQSVLLGRESKASDRGDFARLPDGDDMEIDELA